MTEAFVTLPARIWRDDQTGIWVSHCAPVGVYSQGETEGQALDALQDAVLLYARNTGRRRRMANRSAYYYGLAAWAFGGAALALTFTGHLWLAAACVLGEAIGVAGYTRDT